MIDPEDFGPLDAELRRIKESTTDMELRGAANKMLSAMQHYRKMRWDGNPDGRYLMKCLERVTELQWIESRH